MTTPTILITALTVAALGATPAIASAAAAGPNQAGCAKWFCGVDLSNHNEVLVTSTAG